MTKASLALRRKDGYKTVKKMFLSNYLGLSFCQEETQQAAEETFV